MVTAGLMWHPEMWPTAKIIAMTISPNDIPTPTLETPPPLRTLTAAAPGPAKTSANVPNASAM